MGRWDELCRWRTFGFLLGLLFEPRDGCVGFVGCMVMSALVLGNARSAGRVKRVLLGRWSGIVLRSGDQVQRLSESLLNGWRKDLLVRPSRGGCLATMVVVSVDRV